MLARAARRSCSPLTALRCSKNSRPKHSYHLSTAAMPAARQLSGDARHLFPTLRGRVKAGPRGARAALPLNSYSGARSRAGRRMSLISPTHSRSGSKPGENGRWGPYNDPNSAHGTCSLSTGRLLPLSFQGGTPTERSLGSEFMSDIAAAIMDAAERRMRLSGFYGFSFREIASDVGVKSSSVHYPLPTKEKLAAAG